jgi:hypothetical protein
MKKQALLVVAGSMLAFASCQQEAGMDSAAMQATIDSTVNARVEEIRLQMMASNDSMINALAQWKADSMIAAMKGGTVKTTKPAPKPVAKPKPNVNDVKQEEAGTTKPNTPTGKNNGQGAPTGKNSQSQQTEGQPTGKRGNR